MGTGFTKCAQAGRVCAVDDEGGRADDQRGRMPLVRALESPGQ
ncbi:hypothetical protein [Streptomyces sp. B21-083]